MGFSYTFPNTEFITPKDSSCPVRGFVQTFIQLVHPSRPTEPQNTFPTPATPNLKVDRASFP